ncbi:hypothetical protein EXIGLDRAFT_730194 [Exidia glandulosa HHB12029]|uniref:Uncharacterized protein n=1 Tax=Exidia glandulosa HHB12029 TaxID=1314781 RepID=A0A165CAI5_EXIGL|nr:hypothetical protein EXIGLDRAFT_730194 [Exidia glandulosa HHB12029]
MRGKKWNGRCVATRVDVPARPTAERRALDAASRLCGRYGDTGSRLPGIELAVGWRLSQLMSLGAW